MFWKDTRVRARPVSIFRPRKSLIDAAVTWLIIRGILGDACPFIRTRLFISWSMPKPWSAAQRVLLTYTTRKKTRMGFCTWSMHLKTHLDQMFQFNDAFIGRSCHHFLLFITVPLPGTLSISLPWESINLKSGNLTKILHLFIVDRKVWSTAFFRVEVGIGVGSIWSWNWFSDTW